MARVTRHVSPVTFHLSPVTCLVLPTFYAMTRLLKTAFMLKPLETTPLFWQPLTKGS